MGFLNRTTKQYVHRGSTPDYDPAEWIIHVDMSAVTTAPGNPPTFWPDRYWVISGDTVSLMDQAARDVVDADLAIVRRDQHRAAAEAVPDDRDSEIGFRFRALIGEGNRRDNYLVTRVVTLQEVVMAMLTSTGNAAQMRAAGLAVLAGKTPPDQFEPTATRTRPAAIQSYRGDISGGGADSAGGG